MEWWKIALISLGGIILLLAMIKIISSIRNRNSGNSYSESSGYSYSVNSLLQRASSGIGKLTDCCKKIIRR